MSIEFACSQCGKRLRVGDDAAGKHARCPSCGAVQAVPAMHEPAGPISSLQSSSQPVDNPYEAPASAAWQLHPQGTRAFEPTRFDAGDVFDRSWTIFKSQFGLILGASVILFACYLPLACVAFIVFGALSGPQGQPPPHPERLFGAFFVIWPILFLFDTWLQTGFAILMLKIGRGEPAEFSDLFSGGRFWPQVLLARFLMFVAVGIGELFCFIPGVIAALMFSQAMYLVVDQRQRGLESLRLSSTITNGNKLNILLLVLIMMVVSFLGQLACCIGTIPAFGLINLMWAVAYLMMTGQPTADQLATDVGPDLR